MAILASGSLLFIYLGVVLSVIKMRYKAAAQAEKSFKIPGGLIIPFIAVGSIIWLLCHLNRNEAIATAIFIAAVCLIYFTMRFVQRRRGIQ